MQKINKGAIKVERDAALEVLNAIEDGMSNIKNEKDIWQNELIYALCQGVRLLLIDKIKGK